MSEAAAQAGRRSLGHPALDALAERAHRVEVGAAGQRVVWRRWGEGRPLVLLHGGYGSWMHWARNIDALATGRAVWIADMPGYGDSSDAPREFTPLERLQTLTNALSASLAQLVSATAVIDVAGFSFGGLVAADLAAQRGSVGRLALLGSAGHGGERRQTQPLRLWRHADPAARRDALRHNLGAFMLHDPASIDDLALAIHSASCERTRLRSRDLSRLPLLSGRLARIGCPVLLVWGEHDVTAVPSALAQTLSQRRPERRVHLVAGGGHWIQYECADAVGALLNAFLGRAPA